MAFQSLERAFDQKDDLSMANEARRAQAAAGQLYSEQIRSLEIELGWAKEKANEVASRGWWGRITSSASKDLADVATIQSSINQKVLFLIQETIKLNSFSRIGLEILMHDLRHYIDSGFTDVNGRHFRLSKEGEALAEQTFTHIQGIYNSSKEIDGKVDQNAEEIRALNAKLELKTDLDAKQDAAIARLHELLQANGELDFSQDAAIERLTVQNASLESIGVGLRESMEEQRLSLEARLDGLNKWRVSWRFYLLASHTGFLVWLVYLTWLR